MTAEATAPGTYREPLWSRRDVGRLGVLVAVGAVLLVIAWAGASGRDDAGDQVVFVSIALIGALVGWAGTAAWILGGRRTLSSRRAHLLGEAPARPSAGAVSPTLVAGGDGKWFHRSDCPLVANRGWAPSSRSEHAHAGRSACPGCRP